MFFQWEPTMKTKSLSTNKVWLRWGWSIFLLGWWFNTLCTFNCHFSFHWIYRKAFFEWVPRSPDLTSLDFPLGCQGSFKNCYSFNWRYFFGWYNSYKIFGKMWNMNCSFVWAANSVRNWTKFVSRLMIFIYFIDASNRFFILLLLFIISFLFMYLLSGEEQRNRQNEE